MKIKNYRWILMAYATFMVFSPIYGDDSELDEVSYDNGERLRLVKLQLDHENEAQEQNEEPTVSKQAVYANAFHYPTSIAPDGSKIKFQDGSVWDMDRDYARKVTRWRNSDEIFIKPTSGFFNYYLYILYNQTTGDEVPANLISGTDYLYISSIDYFNGVLVASDGTVFTLDFFNNPIFFDWFVFDPIIIGLNTSAKSFLYTYIIINPKEGFYVEAN